MTMVDEGVANRHGEALVQELLWVHGIIRHNLATIAAVIEQIGNGAPVEQVRAQIDDLATTSVVWTLRVNCLQYCSLVHHHHQLEDVALFPGLRRVNPGLHSVIDKLEADHAIVSGYLDAVEAAAARIVADEAARVDLADALSKLAEHLASGLRRGQPVPDTAPAAGVATRLIALAANVVPVAYAAKLSKQGGNGGS